MNSLLLILLAALWGFSFIFMRIVVPHLGPIPLMFLRVLLAGLVLLPFVGKNQGWALWRKNWRPIMIVGALITAIPFSLMAWVSLSLPAGVTSILGATTPLMVAIWAVFLIGEKLTRQRIIGLSLGLLGVAILALGQGRTFSGASLLPLLAGLVATCCNGWALHRSRQWLSHLSPSLLTASSLLSSSLVLAPFAWVTWPKQSISTENWLIMLTLAWPCSALAYIIFYYLNSQWGSTKTATVNYLIPLFAVLFAHQFLQEAITPTMLLGGLTILTGVGLLNYRKK